MKYDYPTRINEPHDNGFSVYPNPATSEITIETSKLCTAIHLTIMTVDGQKIITRQITEPKTQLDISNLPCGVYCVRVTENMNVTMGKFVKL